jgi:hypothetical protein
MHLAQSHTPHTMILYCLAHIVLQVILNFALNLPCKLFSINNATNKKNIPGVNDTVETLWLCQGNGKRFIIIILPIYYLQPMHIIYTKQFTNASA